MESVGYLYLIEHYNLDVCELLHKSYATDSSEKTIAVNDESSSTYYPVSRYKIDWTWEGQIKFALKNEGVNLEVLKAFLSKIPQVELIAFIESSVIGYYQRRIWFLYEFLFDDELPIPDLKMGNYIDVADAGLQLTVPRSCAVLSRRHRIRNNLIGNRCFCPFVRITDAIRSCSGEMLKLQAKELFQSYPAEILYRAVQYLYLKETKSSYAIEHETPDQRRMDAFVSMLRDVKSQPALDPEGLVKIQNEIVYDRYSHRKSFRASQVYVGQTLAPGRERVHYVAPKPEDVPGIMSAWIETARRMLAAKCDPIATAAVLSFAFVFIHPFDDGNGRIHRFLIHYFLACGDFTPDRIIFPVSATLLKDILAYDRMLESFSLRLMRRIRYEMSEDCEIIVRGDSADWYRFIDFTFIVERFLKIVEQTIKYEWAAELNYLSSYDATKRQMREVVDMPDEDVNRMMRFVCQNRGMLGEEKRRKFFPRLNDEQVSAFEAIIRRNLL